MSLFGPCRACEAKDRHIRFLESLLASAAIHKSPQPVTTETSTTTAPTKPATRTSAPRVLDIEPTPRGTASDTFEVVYHRGYYDGPEPA